MGVELFRADGRTGVHDEANGGFSLLRTRLKTWCEWLHKDGTGVSKHVDVSDNPTGVYCAFSCHNNKKT